MIRAEFLPRPHARATHTNSTAPIPVTPAVAMTVTFVCVLSAAAGSCGCFCWSATLMAPVVTETTTVWTAETSAPAYMMRQAFRIAAGASGSRAPGGWLVAVGYWIISLSSLPIGTGLVPEHAGDTGRRGSGDRLRSRDRKYLDPPGLVFRAIRPSG